MKIRSERSKERLPTRIYRRIVLLRSLKMILSGIGAVAVGVLLFFSVLSYGAQLKQIGVMAYFKSSAIQLINLDFAFIKNVLEAQVQEFEAMHIDLKFKHLLRIEYLKEQALETGIISSAAKNEEFPAKLTFQGVIYDVDISLTGMIALAHLKNPNKWSFQVKVKGDQTIDGMKRFGLLLPTSRGYMTDWLGYELMKEAGLMGLRVDFIDVTINGKAKGIYYLEERFDKHLVENNRLRESILFKLDGGFSAYQENKLLRSAGTRSQVLRIRRMWQSVRNGEMDVENFFDLRKMAKAFVVCDLMNNKHPLAIQNLRFYFNPVTGLTEPIAREWERLGRTKSENLRLFPEKAVDHDRHLRLQRDPILQLIYNNLKFKRYYVEEAEKMCHPEFLDNILNRNHQKIEQLRAKVYRMWPFYNFPTQILYEHQDYMRSKLFPNEPSIVAIWNDLGSNGLVLELTNRQDFPVEIFHLSWRDSIRIDPENDLILGGSQEDAVHLARFPMPPHFEFQENILSDLKVHYGILGSTAEPRITCIQSELVAPSTFTQNAPAINVRNILRYSSMKLDLKENLISIPPGKHLIREDLHIPAGYKLKIEAGAELDFVNSTSLFSQSPVICNGTAEQPIILTSRDSTGGGIRIITEGNHLYFSHVIFHNLRKPEKGDQAAGIISILQSKADFENCTFSGGSEEHSYLSLVQSDFHIGECLFTNISGNAIGLGLSRGVIVNTSFSDIGSTSVECVSSDVEVKQVFMNQVGQVGVKLIQNSVFDGRWLDLRNAAVGLEVIDPDHLILVDSRLTGSEMGITITANGNTASTPSFINIQRVQLSDVEDAYQVSPDNLIVSGDFFINNHDVLEAQTLR